MVVLVDRPDAQGEPPARSGVTVKVDPSAVWKADADAAGQDDVREYAGAGTDLVLPDIGCRIRDRAVGTVRVDDVRERHPQQLTFGRVSSGVLVPPSRWRAAPVGSLLSPGTRDHR